MKPTQITGGFSRRANPRSEATPSKVERTLPSVPFAVDLEVGFDVEIDTDEKWGAPFLASFARSGDFDCFTATFGRREKSPSPRTVKLYSLS